MTAELDDLDSAVRRHDPDRWLATRFIADPRARADVVALYAFNHELARIKGAVSNALMGEIRLTWWSEAVAEIFEGQPMRKHPVSLALADIVARHKLPRPPFETMIEARFPELDGGPVGVAGEAALMTLAARVLGARDHPALSAAAEVYAGQGTRDVANRLLGSMPVQGFPAVAHAALAGYGQASALQRRLRISWAVLRGRI